MKGDTAICHNNLEGVTRSSKLKTGLKCAAGPTGHGMSKVIR